MSDTLALPAVLRAQSTSASSAKHRKCKVHGHPDKYIFVPRLSRFEIGNISICGMREFCLRAGNFFDLVIFCNFPGKQQHSNVSKGKLVYYFLWGSFFSGQI